MASSEAAALILQRGRSKINSQIKFKNWCRKINVIMLFFPFQITMIISVGCSCVKYQVSQTFFMMVYRGVTHCSWQTPFKKQILKPHFFPFFKIYSTFNSGLGRCWHNGGGWERTLLRSAWIYEVIIASHAVSRPSWFRVRGTGRLTLRQTSTGAAYGC